MKFKVHRLEANWLEEGKQEDDWTRGVMSALILTACENGSDIKNKLRAEHPGKQMCDCRSSLLNLRINFICIINRTFFDSELHSSAGVTTFTSQQEGLGFKSTGWCGHFAVEFECSPCVCVDSLQVAACLYPLALR